jgi:hypothetical protein
MPADHQRANGTRNRRRPSTLARRSKGFPGGSKIRWLNSIFRRLSNTGAIGHQLVIPAQPFIV